MATIEAPSAPKAPEVVEEKNDNTIERQAVPGDMPSNPHVADCKPPQPADPTWTLDSTPKPPKIEELSISEGSKPGEETTAAGSVDTSAAPSSVPNQPLPADCKPPQAPEVEYTQNPPLTEPPTAEQAKPTSKEVVEEDAAMHPTSSDEPIDYAAWDTAIVAAITALKPEDLKSRAQQFLAKHPTALSEFRTQISAITDLATPLLPFQHHPTYLLRYLLAEWRDEEAKTFRIDLPSILPHSLSRLAATQKWRSGTDPADDCWSTWGYKNMEDLYANFTSPATQDATLQKWYLQTFYGTDNEGHPLHLELLPSTYHEDLMTPLIIRRVLNNEKTLRERLIKLNPSYLTATQSQLANPILGCTWVLDARQLSLWAGPAMYKTMHGMIGYSTKITSAHYPEQGFRAIIVNLGTVLVSVYNVAIKLMPAQTQRTTFMHSGREVLDEIVATRTVTDEKGVEKEESGLPVMFRKGQGKNVGGLTEEERRLRREWGDTGRWIEE